MISRPIAKFHPQYQRDLILDTDGGVDDAQALLMLLANGRVPSAITTVFGNVAVDQATRNLLSILNFSEAEIPVYQGAARALVACPVDAKHIHGEDGLGGIARPEHSGQPQEEGAVEFLVSTLEEAARSGRLVDLLMIGPLTNLALALRVAPDCLSGIGQLTMMGGTLHGRGNVTPAAEFNIYADPEAAEIVLGSGAQILIAPWETCYEHWLTGAEFDAMVADCELSESGQIFRDLCGHSRKIVENFIGQDRFPLIDPLAAAAVIDPSLVVQSLDASVRVALSDGLTRGMFVVDPSGRLGSPKVGLITAADHQKTKEIISRTLVQQLKTNR